MWGIPCSFWSHLAGKYGNMFYWKEKVNYKVVRILIFLGVEALVNSFQKKEKGVNFRVDLGEPGLTHKTWDPAP
jgi:putative Mn2+ efflux pump MntP